MAAHLALCDAGRRGACDEPVDGERPREREVHVGGIRPIEAPSSIGLLVDDDPPDLVTFSPPPSPQPPPPPPPPILLL